MTMGAIMFYGGIGLFAAALIGMIIANAVLSSKGKKLKELMKDRYGE
ncbi:MAG: hypothetical protein IJU51_01375 [Clostridia bacterium]|nr:hypothetical protein [Clostridia bacterium]